MSEPNIKTVTEGNKCIAHVSDAYLETLDLFIKNNLNTKFYF